MTLFSLSGLLAGISSFALGLLVRRKSSDSKIARSWFLFCLSAAVWGFGSFIIGFLDNSKAALLVWQLIYAFGVIWIAPIFFQFVATFLGKSDTRYIRLNYVIALAFSLLVPTRFFFYRIDFVFNQFWYVRGGIIFPFYFLWSMTLVLICYFRLYQALRDVSSTKRNQIQYFLLAIWLGFTGGSFCYLPNFGVDLYPWGSFTLTLYPLIMSYAILKYRLMDVRLFFRRAGLFLLVYASLILASIPLVNIIHHKITQVVLTSPSFLITEVFTLAVIFSVGPFVYAYIVRQSSLFNQDTIASLAHELKSPLASVEGAFDYIFETDPLDPQQKATYKNIIQRNISRLSYSVDELIQVMQFQHSKGLVNKTDDVDVAELIKESHHKFQPLAEMKGLKLTYEAPTLFAICDPLKIEQSISNLVSNAVKFSDKGEIKITLKKVAHDLLIEVVDQGKGMPAHDLNRIFDRFYKGSKDKKAKGTGIGLTIAKRWVEAHGGEIHAESDGVGQGSRVWFTLPVS